MTEKELYSMGLHEIALIKNERGITKCRIMRVHGGWIYHYEGNSVFVPEKPEEDRGIWE